MERTCTPHFKEQFLQFVPTVQVGADPSSAPGLV